MRGLKLVPVFRSVIFFLTHRLRVTYSVAEVVRLAILMVFLIHYLCAQRPRTAPQNEPLTRRRRARRRALTASHHTRLAR